MSLNPGRTMEQLWDEQLDEMFHYGQSPYFNMYKAGLLGIPIDVVSSKLTQIGIPLRAKDIENWQSGMFKHQMNSDPMFKPPAKRETETGVPFDNSHLEDFPMFPLSWVGTEKRFFPCTQDNKPMQKWGWSKDFHPQLYTLADAKALSPIGWVGQNMLYQRFIVLDIDGAGHGSYDQKVINFGSKYKDKTMCLEDPVKPGSFHLYFSTDRLIPVRHFPWAKLDLMGNAVNAAVYMKNKQNNGLKMSQLSEEVWQDMLSYQQSRKERDNGSQPNG